MLRAVVEDGKGRWEYIFLDKPVASKSASSTFR
jgi:hypothetical protein